jgi:WD40 repeat protein
VVTFSQFPRWRLSWYILVVCRIWSHACLYFLQIPTFSCLAPEILLYVSGIGGGSVVLVSALSICFPHLKWPPVKWTPPASYAKRLSLGGILSMIVEVVARKRPISSSSSSSCCALCLEGWNFICCWHGWATGMFGTVAKTGRLQAHDAMITCLDAIDTNFILSAGMDTRVLRWDFRTLANQVSLTLFMPCCEPNPPQTPVHKLSSSLITSMLKSQNLRMLLSSRVGVRQ